MEADQCCVRCAGGSRPGIGSPDAGSCIVHAVDKVYGGRKTVTAPTNSARSAQTNKRSGGYNALDYLDIAGGPADEEVEQAMVPGYNMERNRAECTALIAQLRRELGQEPEGARLFVKWEKYNDSGYYEVACKYTPGNMESVDYAFKCEAEMPRKWDTISKEYLTHYQVGVQR